MKEETQLNISNIDLTNPYEKTTFDLGTHHILLVAWYAGYGMSLNFPAGNIVYLVRDGKKIELFKYQKYLNQTDEGQLEETKYYVKRLKELRPNYMHESHMAIAIIVSEMIALGMVRSVAMMDEEVQMMVKEAQESMKNS
jgi:hypothetical protein